MRDALLIGLMPVLLLAGCGKSRWLTEFELDEHTFDSEAIQMIEKDSGLTIPGGARGLNFRFSPPIDPQFAARIEIPDEFQGSIQSQIEAIQDMKINTSGGVVERISWWPPPKAATIIDRQNSGPTGEYLRAALTIEDSRTILYVYHGF